jgi:hypothetical protein
MKEEKEKKTLQEERDHSLLLSVPKDWRYED